MKPEYKALGDFGTLGLEIVLCILVGVFGGRWLDGKLGTPPIFMALGFLFGVGAAGKALFRTWKEMKEVTAREEREQGNPTPRFDPAKAEPGKGPTPPRDEEDRRDQA
jgi:ATP synthase protein I